MKSRAIETAMQLFARRGYDGTSMSDIATALDVSKAALYYHFASKDDLYTAAMQETVARLVTQVENETRHIENSLDLVRAILHAHVRLFRDEPDLIRALYHNLLTPSAPGPHHAMTDSDTPLYRALEACVADGTLDAKEISDVFVLLKGGLEYLGVRWLLDPRRAAPEPADVDRLVERVVPSPPRVDRRSGPSGLGLLGVVLGAVLGALVVGSVVVGSAVAGTDPVVDDPTSIVVIAGDSAPMGLDDCLDEIVEFNAALAGTREGRNELSGQLWQARASGLPSVDVVGNWSRSRDPSFALDETFGAPTGDDDTFLLSPEDIPPQTFWRASIDATWDLNPTEILNAVGGARLGIARQEAIADDAEHRLVERGVETYARLLRAWESVRAAESEITARDEFLDITRRRYRLDVATALDTLQAAVSKANATPLLRRAEGDLRSIGAELNALMGRPVASPLTIVPSLPLETGSVDEAVALDLAASRPDVRELEYTIAIQRKNRGVRKAAARPRLGLFGSYGYVAREFGDLGDSDQDTWRASATVTVPIFDGFLTKGRVREVEATIRRVEFERDDRVRTARAEVMALLTDLDVARDDLTAARLNVARGDDALRIATLRYENDRADYLSVLNAESERAVARQNLIQARYEVLTRTAALKRAMGLSPMASLDAVDDAWHNRKKGFRE